MEREFFLIDSSSMKSLGIRPGDDTFRLAKIFNIEAGHLKGGHLREIFPSIKGQSTVLPVDPQDHGAVIGCNMKSDELFEAYYGRFVNHPAVHFLDKFGYSIDGPALNDSAITPEQQSIVRNNLVNLLQEKQASGKSISEFDQNEFVEYIKRETNIYGETMSPVVALSVGRDYFKNYDLTMIKNKASAAVEVMNYLSQEFPDQMAVKNIQKSAQFTERKSGLFPKVKIFHPKTLKDALSSLNTTSSLRMKQ